MVGCRSGRSHGDDSFHPSSIRDDHRDLDSFVELARRAGLPSIRLHDLRHSHATAALASGVPVTVVSQRIGHADVGVTLKVYAHVLPGDDEDAALRADSLLAP